MSKANISLPVSPNLPYKTSKYDNNLTSPTLASPLSPPQARPSTDVTESTPLLHSSQSDYRDISHPFSHRSQSRAYRTFTWLRSRKFTILCFILLNCFIVFIITACFIIPPAISTYIKQAHSLSPSMLAIDSFTDDGFIANIAGDFHFLPSHVQPTSARWIGLSLSRLIPPLTLGPTLISLTLPDFSNSTLATLSLPPIKLTIAPYYLNRLKFNAHVSLHSSNVLKNLANVALSGSLQSARITWIATTTISSGFLFAGNHALEGRQLIQAKSFPPLPHFTLTNLTVSKFTPSLDQSDDILRSPILIDATFIAPNEFPVTVTFPSPHFDIYIPSCSNDYALLLTRHAQTLTLTPHHDIRVNLRETLSTLPESVLSVCPGRNVSALDTFIDTYSANLTATLYIRASSPPSSSTPPWLWDALANQFFRLSVVGDRIRLGRPHVEPFSHEEVPSYLSLQPLSSSPPQDPFQFTLIHNVSLTDIHFHLPSLSRGRGVSWPFEPRISARARIFLNIPDPLHFTLDVVTLNSVRLVADLMYSERTFARISANDHWTPVNVTFAMISTSPFHRALRLSLALDREPLDILDYPAFLHLLRSLILEDRRRQDIHQSTNHELHTLTADDHISVYISLDLNVHTSLGPLILRNLHLSPFAVPLANLTL